MELLREEKLGSIDNGLIHLIGAVNEFDSKADRNNSYALNSCGHRTQGRESVESEWLVPFVCGFTPEEVLVTRIELLKSFERLHNTSGQGRSVT